MSDSISPERRSWNMSRIKNKDTKIEILVRSFLFSKGFRFRKNDRRYPGKPDVLLPKFKTAIFVNGCFWHRHLGCKNATMPKTNTDFWAEKLAKNVANDEKHYSALRSAGWIVIVLWECQLEKNFDSTMNNVVSILLEEDKHG